MKIAKLKIENLPKILHVDGDSFFASVETALDHHLRGKPVVTGGDRGIASAMSKEAKALGVHRGMPIFKIRKLLPQVIIRSSDYLNYAIFAERMYAIVRRYSDDVEEYSIDECFAILDLTSRGLVQEIKTALQNELGLTFSLGLAPTKTLAKLASSQNKPDGLTILNSENTNDFLKRFDVGKVWGIGPASAEELRKLGIKTALDLRSKTPEWARDNLEKHLLLIYHELRGENVLSVHTETTELQKSIQATRTFSPPSSNAEIILSELSKNIENAFVKMRREGQWARKLSYFLKTEEYRYHRREHIFDVPQNTPEKAVKLVSESLSKIIQSKTIYRSTGVTLSGLVTKSAIQDDLFGTVREQDDWSTVYKAVEALEGRYGGHVVVLGSSLEAYKRRKMTPHRHLRIPFIGEVK